MRHFIIISFSLLVLSCSFDKNVAAYEDKLVVFCNLGANLPMGRVGDTCYVSISSDIEAQVDMNDLYIENAAVTITEKSTGVEYIANPVPGRIGRYLTPDSVIFLPGKTYILSANYGSYEVTAETTIPDGMDFFSPVNQSYVCDNKELVVPSVNVDNFEFEWIHFLDQPDTLINLIDFHSISNAVYKNGGCYTESFASFPLFLLDFEESQNTAIKITTLALEAAQRGLEPFNDLNGDGIYTISTDSYSDFNRNQVRDSTFVNLIYDTSLVYKIWKEDYLRDENGDPYRINPFTWQASTPPISMSWLFFNYYGLHLIIVETTDDAYYNYFKGDPVGQNQYLLPESNIENGYGLFSSTNAKAFLVNIIRDE